MRRLLTISFTVIVIFALSSSSVAQDFRTNPNPTQVTYGQLPLVDASVTITHSASQTILPGNSVACTSGGTQVSENHFWRSFVLADFGLTLGLNVTAVEVGIETCTGPNGGTQPLTCNLYTTDLPFPTGTLTLIGTNSLQIPDQSGTIFSIPVTGTAGAGSELVVEISNPADTGDFNLIWLGSNNLGETAPTYISSDSCGISTPVTMATIGFPTMHLVLNVIGDEIIPIDKLLLTEFVVTPTGAEFIEIYNPNASPVELTNYYLSDVSFDGGPEYYYHVVQGLYGGTFGDFNSKFPDGAMIGPMEYQIVALNGDADFFTAYGDNPTYEIDQPEFLAGTPDAIPDMMETHPGSIYGPDSLHNPGLTNVDEVVVLYYWDGMSDIVGDVDYVLYNSASPTPNNEAVDKTGVTIDGPDPDGTGTTYLNDTPVANQLSALNHSGGFSTQRVDYTEGAQIMTGGNGVTGSDETSEDLNNTWAVDIPTPFAPIPVELTSFTAQVSGESVSLNWSTATELNNQGFEVQRKTDTEFKNIGFVQGHGTTTEVQNYSFVDDVSDAGTYYYRLKQVDYDGSFEYSSVVEVEIVAPLNFALDQNYPNPFNPSTMISFSLAVDSKVSLRVFDILGQEVANLLTDNLTTGTHEINFDASKLNSGVYFYSIDAAGLDGSNFHSVKKMVLTK